MPDSTREGSYDIAALARDDFPRFLELVDCLSPRDAEIMLCFALLQKRPTDLSILFGKAGHRAEEDLHKAAHKLAGLIEFGPLPDVGAISGIMRRVGCGSCDCGDVAVAVQQYARSRDFATVEFRGLRKQMLHAFKVLHASEGREEGLLAGWILWLVDGAEPKGKGWRKRKNCNTRYKLGPTTFRIRGSAVDELQSARLATQRGGRAQRTKNVKIKRTLKLSLLKGM